jgi:hypothetical protein
MYAQYTKTLMVEFSVIEGLIVHLFPKKKPVVPVTVL